MPNDDVLLSLLHFCIHHYVSHTNYLWKKTKKKTVKVHPFLLGLLLLSSHLEALNPATSSCLFAPTTTTTYPLNTGRWWRWQRRVVFCCCPSSFITSKIDNIYKFNPFLLLLPPFSENLQPLIRMQSPAASSVPYD